MLKFFFSLMSSWCRQKCNHLVTVHCGYVAYLFILSDYCSSTYRPLCSLSSGILLKPIDHIFENYVIGYAFLPSTLYQSHSFKPGKVPPQRREGRHKIPALLRSCLQTDFLGKGKSVFSNRLSLGATTTLQGRPCEQEYLSSTNEPHIPSVGFLFLPYFLILKENNGIGWVRR